MDWICKGGDVNASDNRGYRALHYAACRDHSDVVRTLLLHKADILGGSGPFSPLRLAIYNDSSFAADVLLSFGADSTKLSNGTGTVATASMNGAVNCVRVLLKYNADVNWTDKVYDCGALFLACAGLHADIQKFRKDKDAMLTIIRTLASSDGINLNHRAVNRLAALHKAAEVDSIEAVKCLVEAGAIPSIEDGEGFTPVDYAETDSEVKHYLLSCQGKLIMSRSNSCLST